MLVPAIPADDYSKYFSVKELALIFEKRTMVSMREALRRWANDPAVRLRLYYRPGIDIFRPDPAFHLEDVLALGTASGYLRVTSEFLEETLSERAAATASVPSPSWNSAPYQFSTP